MKKLLKASGLGVLMVWLGLSSAMAVEVSANASLNSDYRFRGVSQTNSGPAFQGGFDADLGQGFYVGNWNSNVNFPGTGSGTSSGSSGLEIDVYGGYRGDFRGVGYDVGGLYYLYEGVTVAPGSPKLDTFELYGKLSYGGFYGKVSYAASKDYFGMTAANGSIDQKGSLYYDLGYSYDMSKDLSVKAHYGRTSYDKAIGVTGGTAKSYQDYSLGVSYVRNKLTYSATWVGTNNNARRLFGKDSTEDTLVLSIGTSF